MWGVELPSKSRRRHKTNQELLTFRPSTSSSRSERKKVILPQLSAATIRPSTASSPLRKEESCSTNRKKASMLFKVDKFQTTRGLEKIKNESSNREATRVRPRTAPFRNKGAHEVIGEVATAGLSLAERRESFNLKQKARHRKRAEIYAINKVRKMAFDRDFESYIAKKDLETSHSSQADRRQR